MPDVWVCLKKPFNCCCHRRNSEDVHDPVKNQIEKTSNTCSGCSRSLQNLRNPVINNSDKRALQISSIISSRSLERSNFLNALRFDELCNDDSNGCKCSSCDESNLMTEYNRRISLSSAASSDIVIGCRRCCSQRRVVTSFECDICEFGALACRICHLKFKDLDAFEAHFLSNHSVTKLVAGEFSTKVVELICNTNRCSKSDKTRGNIAAILKVHNMQKTIVEFENYRESVKSKCSEVQKKHSRCLVDGNEFLGFHGTTLACFLGLSESSDLCLSDQCGVCRILRNGFSLKTISDGINGIRMSSTSIKALECIEIDQKRSRGVAKALLLCRVIAGRVHKSLKRFEQFSDSSAFDSVAMKMGPNSSIEELSLLSTKALLPCFVIIFKS